MWYCIIWPCGFFVFFLSRRHVASFPHRRYSFPLLHLSLNPSFQSALDFFLLRPFPGASEDATFAVILEDKTGSCTSACAKPTCGPPFGTQNGFRPSICPQLLKLKKKKPPSSLSVLIFIHHSPAALLSYPLSLSIL